MLPDLRCVGRSQHGASWKLFSSESQPQPFYFPSADEHDLNQKLSAWLPNLKSSYTRNSILGSRQHELNRLSLQLFPGPIAACPKSVQLAHCLTNRIQHQFCHQVNYRYASDYYEEPNTTGLPTRQLWSWEHVQILGQTFIGFRIGIYVIPKHRRIIQIRNGDLLAWHQGGNQNVSPTVRNLFYAVSDGGIKLKAFGQEIVADANVVCCEPTSVSHDNGMRVNDYCVFAPHVKGRRVTDVGNKFRFLREPAVKIHAKNGRSDRNGNCDNQTDIHGPTVAHQDVDEKKKWTGGI